MKKNKIEIKKVITATVKASVCWVTNPLEYAMEPKNRINIVYMIYNFPNFDLFGFWMPNAISCEYKQGSIFITNKTTTPIQKVIVKK